MTTYLTVHLTITNEILFVKINVDIFNSYSSLYVFDPTPAPT